MSCIAVPDSKKSWMTTLDIQIFVNAMVKEDLASLRVHCCVIANFPTGELHCFQTLSGRNATSKPNLKVVDIYLLNCGFNGGPQLDHWSLLHLPLRLRCCLCFVLCLRFR
jgi:hypothetical protein